jgi:hypothetical protein
MYVLFIRFFLIHATLTYSLLNWLSQEQYICSASVVNTNL